MRCSVVVLLCVVGCAADALSPVEHPEPPRGGLPAEADAEPPAAPTGEVPEPPGVPPAEEVPPDEPPPDEPPIEPEDPPADPYVAHDHIDCRPTPGEPGEDLYWIDSNGAPAERYEDCGYFGANLNCAGANMGSDGEANAARQGLNSEAYLGCCGPQASTIDRYGCLPYSELGEPCFDDLRYFNRCVAGLACKRASSGPYPQTCQVP